MTHKLQVIVSKFIELVSEMRREKGWTLEELADRAGVHRTTVGLLERMERRPSLEVALRLASALDVRLTDLIDLAEKKAGSAKEPTPKTGIPRLAQSKHFRNEEHFLVLTGLGYAALEFAINSCYQTFDFIDQQLLGKNLGPMSKLIELANFSSVVGNLIGSGIADASKGLYKRNRPHAFPDLVPQSSSGTNLEVKIALETNRPKGHLPKPGTYITARYVLADRTGVYRRGKKNRSDTVWIWEVRVGKLDIGDFDCSSTTGDSGKTAVISSAAFEKMHLVYLVPELNPYARKLFS